MDEIIVGGGFKLRLLRRTLMMLFARKTKYAEFDLRAVKKVLYIVYPAIGDLMLTTPVFRELKARFPQIQIDVLASNRNHELLKYNPYITNVFVYDRRNFFSRLKIYLECINLRRQNYDMVIELWRKLALHQLLRLRLINGRYNACVRKVMKCEQSFGCKTSQLPIYDFVIGTLKVKHWSEIFLDTLKIFQVDSQNTHYDFFMGKEETDRAAQYFKNIPWNKTIGLNIEGSGKDKALTRGEIIYLCKMLIERLPDAGIILIGTSTRQNEMGSIVSEIGTERVRAIYNTQTIIDVGAAVTYFDLIISPDTAIIHIAAAFNKKIVGIYTGSREFAVGFAIRSNNDFRRIFSPHTDCETIRDFDIEAVVNGAVEMLSGEGESAGIKNIWERDEMNEELVAIW